MCNDGSSDHAIIVHDDSPCTRRKQAMRDAYYAKYPNDPDNPILKNDLMQKLLEARMRAKAKIRNAGRARNGTPVVRESERFRANFCRMKK